MPKARHSLPILNGFTFEEGFNELYYVTIGQEGEFVVDKWQDEV
jgi:hypothetical protein